MTLAEPRDHRVVGDSVADNEAVTGIAAGLFNAYEWR